jgi:hypothetical protein
MLLAFSFQKTPCLQICSKVRLVTSGSAWASCLCCPLLPLPVPAFLSHLSPSIPPELPFTSSIHPTPFLSHLIPPIPLSLLLTSSTPTPTPHLLSNHTPPIPPDLLLTSSIHPTSFLSRLTPPIHLRYSSPLQPNLLICYPTFQLLFISTTIPPQSA